METMSAVNAVQLFILVWTFSAVCRADDDISVNCEDVTGIVSQLVTFNCNVTLKKSGHCITVYKFYYTENNTDSTICREEVPPDPCKQRNNFTCIHTPTTVMKGQFRFFITTECGWEETEFTVDITETSKHEPVTEDPKSLNGVTEPHNGPGPQPETTVIAAVTGCFIIIIIIIIMIIIYKKTPNYSKPCGFQRRIFRGYKHNDNNSSNIQEQNPDNVM